jgi:hypothetical protein
MQETRESILIVLEAKPVYHHDSCPSPLVGFDQLIVMKLVRNLNDGNQQWVGH